MALYLVFLGVVVLTPEASKKLLKRRGRKAMTSAFLLGLVDAAKDWGGGNADINPWLRRYWSTWHCGESIEVVGDQIAHSRTTITRDGKTWAPRNYCGRRWCLICSGIRSAKAINHYGPIISTWKAPYFVTLTIPNVPKDGLLMALNSMLIRFNLIKKRFRNWGQKMIAIRKTEVTYNRIRDDYHPHYHLVLDGSSVAPSALIDEWLAEWPEATIDGQDFRKVSSKEGFIELFKYVTKLVTKVGGKLEGIPARNLHTIFEALSGKRTLQPVGFRVPKEIEEVDEDLEGTPQLVLHWDGPNLNYFDAKTGEIVLPNYVGVASKLIDDYNLTCEE